jgi:hypothetical protein
MAISHYPLYPGKRNIFLKLDVCLCGKRSYLKLYLVTSSRGKLWQQKVYSEINKYIYTSYQSNALTYGEKAACCFHSLLFQAVLSQTTK